MIEKNNGTYSLVCDNCGEDHPEQFDSFHDAVDAKMELGWRCSKATGVWRDVCPDCQD